MSPNNSRTFTAEKIQLMEDLIDEYAPHGGRVPWKSYQAEIGHPIASIYVTAMRLRDKRKRRRERLRIDAERELIDIECGYRKPSSEAGVTAPKPGSPAGKVKQKHLTPHVPITPPKKILDYARATSLSKFVAAHFDDVALRIQHQGLTAGIMGDPPKGRSALDQRLGLTTARADDPPVRCEAGSKVL